MKDKMFGKSLIKKQIFFTKTFFLSKPFSALTRLKLFTLNIVYFRVIPIVKIFAVKTIYLKVSLTIHVKF